MFNGYCECGVNSGESGRRDESKSCASDVVDLCDQRGHGWGVPHGLKYPSRLLMDDEPMMFSSKSLDVLTHAISTVLVRPRPIITADDGFRKEVMSNPQVVGCLIGIDVDELWASFRSADIERLPVTAAAPE